ncbi:hypothetical protein G7Y79_00001g001320 [Physcia stellaris]|nr:hypothetical protein G7Y79_00001g001320 [Physcia stellaris]
MAPNQHCGKDVLQVMNPPRTEMLTPDLLKYVSTSTALVPVVCGDCDLEVQVQSHQCNDEQMNYTTTVTYDAYVSTSYSCFSSEALQIETGESIPKVTITRTSGPIQTVTQTVQEIMTAVKQRRWKSPHGSPTNYRVKPTPVHQSKPSEDSLKETPTVSEYEILTAVKHRRWNSPHGSPTNYRVKPTPVHESKPSEDSLKETPTVSEYEILTAVKHRRWKSPHGSPTHGHTEPSSIYSTKTLEFSSKDTTTSSLSQSKDSSSKTLATPTSSGSCTPAGSDVTDTPASRDENTGLLFRSSCGVSDATFSECPYLCSQAGGGLFKQCSKEDVTGDEPIGQFPPVALSASLQINPRQYTNQRIDSYYGQHQFFVRHMPIPLHNKS